MSGILTGAKGLFRSFFSSSATNPADLQIAKETVEVSQISRVLTSTHS